MSLSCFSWALEIIHSVFTATVLFWASRHSAAYNQNLLKGNNRKYFASTSCHLTFISLLSCCLLPCHYFPVKWDGYMLPQNGSDFMWLLKWVKNCLEILLVEIIPSSPSVWHPWTLQMQWTAEQTFLWHLNCVFKQWYPKAKSGANILHHYWYLWSCNYLRLSSHTSSTKHLSVGGFAALHDKHSINPPKNWSRIHIRKCIS